MEVELDFLKYFFYSIDEDAEDDYIDQIKYSFLEDRGYLPRNYEISHRNKPDVYTRDETGLLHREIGFGCGGRQ